MHKCTAMVCTKVTFYGYFVLSFHYNLFNEAFKTRSSSNTFPLTPPAAVNAVPKFKRKLIRHMGWDQHLKCTNRRSRRVRLTSLRGETTGQLSRRAKDQNFYRVYGTGGSESSSSAKHLLNVLPKTEIAFVARQSLQDVFCWRLSSFEVVVAAGLFCNRVKSSSNKDEPDTFSTAGEESLLLTFTSLIRNYRVQALLRHLFLQ